MILDLPGEKSLHRRGHYKHTGALLMNRVWTLYRGENIADENTHPEPIEGPESAEIDVEKVLRRPNRSTQNLDEIQMLRSMNQELEQETPQMEPSKLEKKRSRSRSPIVHDTVLASGPAFHRLLKRKENTVIAIL